VGVRRRSPEIFQNSILLEVNFSAFLEQEILFLVQDFEVKNYGKKLRVHFAFRSFLPPGLNRKDENFFSALL
jgi:hypothetical protein